jgi:hypothetical protein
MDGAAVENRRVGKSPNPVGNQADVGERGSLGAADVGGGLVDKVTSGQVRVGERGKLASEIFLGEADDGGDSYPKKFVDFVGNLATGLVEVAAALRVADEAVLGTETLELLGTDRAGVGAGRKRRDIL